MNSFESLERTIADIIPLTVYRTLIPRRVLGLVYHTVTDRPLPHLQHLYPVKTSQMFERDLRYLKNHFQVIDYKILLQGLHGETDLPPNSLFLSFDDGYKECFSTIRPMLLQYDLPCTFFVITDCIDNRKIFYRNQVSLCLDRINQLDPTQLGDLYSEVNRVFGGQLSDRSALQAWVRSLGHDDMAALNSMCALLGIQIDQFLTHERPYLTTAEIQILAADGFSIGAHSRRHVKFNLLNQEQIEIEMRDSCAQVAEISGQPAIPFAFPFSGAGVDGTMLAEVIGRYDFLDLVFDARGITREHPHVIDRIWADPPAGANEPHSNLGDLIHTAYRDYVLWRRRYYQSTLKAKLKGQ